MDLWMLPAGQGHTDNELVHWHGKGHRSLLAALSEVDTVVLAPHAGAAFPAEWQAFLAPGLSRRQQMDFSDCLTGPLARAWADANARVLAIENPHSRLVSDPNRSPSATPMQDLAECFRRLRQTETGELPALGGVDGIRPITFSGQPVLLEPSDDTQWQAFERIWRQTCAQGVDVYRQLARDLVAQCLTLCQARGQPLRVFSLHDTMNTKMRPDGALVVERPAADRLPSWLNLGNVGGPEGEAEDTRPNTLEAVHARELRGRFEEALQGLERHAEPAVTLNQPYKGAFETQWFGALLRSKAPPGSGAVQLEFLREVLLGPEATAHLHQSGTDWPAPDLTRLTRIGQALAAAL